MATAAEIRTKTAKYLVNVDAINAIVNGPSTGPNSIVMLESGPAKTLSRILLEMGVPPTVAEWDADTAYPKGSWVIYLGNTWYAKKDVPAGIVPVEGEYWGLLGAGVSTPQDLSVLAYAAVQEAEALLAEMSDFVDEISGEASQAAQDAQDALDGLQQETEARVEEAQQLADEIQAQADELAAQADDIQANSNAILDLQAPYINEKSYAIGDTVFYQGEIYQAILATTGHLPTDPTYWKKIGDYGSYGAGLAAQALAIQTINTSITSINGTLTSQTSAITDLTTRMTTAEGGINAQASAITALTTRVTNAEGVNTSQATSLTNLNSRITAAEGNISTQATAISGLTTRVTAAEGNITSTSTALTSLTGRVTTAESNITANATALTGLTTRVTAAEGNITSQSSSITSLASRITAAEGVNTTQATALNSLDTRVSSVEGVNTTQSTAITSLTGRMNTAETNITTQGSAISSLTTRMTSAEGNITSTSSALTALQASISDVGGQNLLYNPGFDIGSGTMADGWQLTLSGTAAGTAALAVSSLDNTGNAQTLNLTGLGTTATTNYAFVEPQIAYRPGVRSGQAVAFSFYVQATAGLTIRAQIRTYDAFDNTNLLDIFTTTLTADNTWQRINVILPAASSTAKCIRPILFVYGSGSLTAGVARFDRAQAEYGPNVTGWRDNAATTASAVSGLDARVTSAEGTITSQSSSITSLTNRMTSAEGVNTTQATAISGLTTRMTSAEGVNTSQGTSITNLTTRITSAEGDISTQGSALSSLTTRVTTAEGNISSINSSITSLSASISDTGGENLVYNPTFQLPLPLGSATVADGWNSSASAAVIYTPSRHQNTSNDIYQRFTVSSGLTSSFYVQAYSSYCAIDSAKSTYTASAYVVATAGLMCLIYLQYYDADNVPLATFNSTLLAANGSWQRHVISGARPSGAVSARIFVRTFGTASLDAGTINWKKAQIEAGSTATAWRDNILGTASAVSALDARVTSVEGVNTSQATSISTLSTTVSGHTSSISTINSVQSTQTGQIATLRARAAVLLNVDGFIAGYEINSTGATSDFKVLAGKFYVVGPGNIPVIPFYVDAVNNVIRMTNVIVDTLQIAGNAVTMADDNTYQNRTVNSTSQPVINSVNMTTVGGKVKIFCTWWTDPFHGSSFYIDIVRDSTTLITIDSMQLTTQYNTWTVGFIDKTAPAGNHTWYIKARNKSGSDTVIGVTYTFMDLLETRR